MNKFLFFTALAIASSPPTLADTGNKLEELIVVSSRVEMPLRRVGTSVSVVTGDEIRARGFNSLFEVLRSQPAIAASNSGGAGSATSLRIRGEEGYRTRVFIDGIDISNAAGIQIGPNIEHLLSAGVERVEILRGPQGLMYGADAGGVINISTQTSSQGLDGTLSAEGGRYGTVQTSANLGGGNDAVDFNISAADFSNDGFSSRTTDTTLDDDDGYDNTTLHARIGWNVSSDLRLEIAGRDVSSENEYDDCFTVETFAPSDACDNDFDQQAWRAQADYSAGRFTHQLAYTGNETDLQFFTEGQSSFGGDGDLQRWTYLGSFTGSDAMRLVYGVDLQSESFDDGLFERDRDQNGYYVEYQGRFADNVFLTAGARYDDNDDFGTHTTYRVSGAYLIPFNSSELKLKGAYGTGFRAPSLYEIAYNSSSLATLPAFGTTPAEEESEGFDIGLAWSTDNGLYLEANYFDQSISDEIFFDLVSFSGYLQDSGTTDSRGIELAAEAALLESLSVSANYTYNDTENASGSTRFRRPKHLANLGLNWRPLAAKLVLGLNVRGSYDAEDIDGAALDDYEVLDLNASYEIVQGLQLYGRVENLLDEDYEEVPTYNTSGAAAYAGVRYSF